MSSVDISLMFDHVINWNSFHSINLDFWITSVRQRIWNWVDSIFVNLFYIIKIIFVISKLTWRQWIASPGPVNNFLWQMWHLKCLAFWCWIRTASSSNSLLQYQHQGRTVFLFFRPIFQKFNLNFENLVCCNCFSQPAKSVYLLLNFFVWKAGGRDARISPTGRSTTRISSLLTASACSTYFHRHISVNSVSSGSCFPNWCSFFFSLLSLFFSCAAAKISWYFFF